VPVGDYEANPLLSAPELVGQVIESWKLTRYEGAPIEGRLPLCASHELFAVAWARVPSGDAPAFAPAPRTG
jgi:hypothetical protein